MILTEQIHEYYHNEFLPLFGPGGMYHIPKKNKGLRVDDVD